jgi:hypothetical protein
MIANRGVLRPRKIYKTRTNIVIASSIFFISHQRRNNLYHRQEKAQYRYAYESAYENQH